MLSPKTPPASDALRRFEMDGVLSPIRVFDSDEADDLRRRFDALEAREGGRLTARTNKKPHLLLPWLADLVRHERIVGAVCDLLGPDLLCWSSMFFAKPAREGAYVAWHQDATYWGLSRPDIVTAWLAFTPSTVANGCLRVVPESHHQDQLPHRTKGDDRNMLSRSQEIAVEIDESAVTDVVLAPGEMSIHHVKLIHGSEPNKSDQPRIGLAIRYISAHVRQLTTFRDSATLVAGGDFGNFDPEPAPIADFHPDAVAYHAAMLERQADIRAAIP